MTEGRPEHITVVFAGQSESWAQWIAEQIDGAGPCPASLIRWHPLQPTPPGTALATLLAGPGRLLLVIDDWYLRFDLARYRAWGEVLRRIVPAHRDRVAAVSVTSRALPEAATALAPVPLRGLGENEARRRVLAAAGLPEKRAARSVPPGRRRFPDDLPDIWNAPRRNRRFTGRERILTRLHDVLADGGDDTAIVALHGPTGVGKTAVALEYVHRYLGEYDIVWWVNATLPLTAREQFAGLAGRLGAEAGTEIKSLVAAARQALGTSRRRWLIVLDDTEQAAALEELIPSGAGHVLITTTRGDWSAHGAELVELPFFHREESIAFACRRAARLTEEEADRLAAAVEDMPLLVDQTAAWLETNPTADVRGYLRDIEGGDPHSFGVNPSGEYPLTFQVAWAKTLNSLYEDSPTVSELLRLFAVFSPDEVPVRLLYSARSADLPPHLAALTADPSSWNSALRTLSEATSMRFEYDRDRLDVHTVSSIRMHRLFHRFVRTSMSPEEHVVARRTAWRLLSAARPGSPTVPEHWHRYAGLIPHLEPSGALRSPDEDVRALVLDCIEYLRIRGEYHDGWWLTREVVRHWADASGATDRKVLVAVHQQANMLRRMGRYYDAAEVGRDALRRVTAASGGHGIEVVRAKSGLGGTLMAMGRYGEARDLLEEALSEAVAVLDDRDVPRVLSLRHNLAIAVGLQGHYAQALEMHQATLESAAAVLGDRGYITLHAALHTAWTLRLMTRYRDALLIQERNYELRHQALGTHHPQTLLAAHNLALCMRRLGVLQGARDYMAAVLRALRERQGPQHPETLLVSGDYAMLLRELGELTEAGELAEFTARQQEVLHGPEHPYAIGAEDNRATVERYAGRIEAARARSERALTAMVRVMGPGHPWTLGIAMNTASARAAAGETGPALELGRRTLDRARRSLGAEHVLTVNVQAGLAQDLRAAGQRQEGDRLTAQALDLLAGGLGRGYGQTRYLSAGGRPYWDFEAQPI
jgi:tetratricopeptide (TPR) repeat protein